MTEQATGTVVNQSVRSWVNAHARPITPRPDSALGLPGSLRGAQVVGIACSLRSGREVVTAVGAILRELVVDAGFRAVMIEGCDPIAAELDRHLHPGAGDVVASLAGGQRFVRYLEVAAVLDWLRRWNRAHPDEAVSVVHDRVRRDLSGSLEHVERQLASRDLEWVAATGQRVVHWGGTAHVVAGDPRTVPPDLTHPNAGGLLRRELGNRYGVIAVTIGTATGPQPLPPPAPDFTEHAFADVTKPVSLLDLKLAIAGPDEVRAWLRTPLRTRMIGPTYRPDADREARIDAGPLATTVDAIMHIRHVSPATALPGT